MSGMAFDLRTSTNDAGTRVTLTVHRRLNAETVQWIGGQLPTGTRLRRMGGRWELAGETAQALTVGQPVTVIAGAT